MVTLSFIILALFPIVLPSVLALVGLVFLACAPHVTVCEAPEVLNEEALDLGLDVVEAAITARQYGAPVVVPVVPEPTMADALFAGMAAYTKIRNSYATVIQGSGV